MTETTTTRLAAAIVDAREQATHIVNDYDNCCGFWRNKGPGEFGNDEPPFNSAYTAALTRLEKLCVAQGRWEEQQQYPPCIAEDDIGGCSRYLTPTRVDELLLCLFCTQRITLQRAIEALLREET